MPRQQPERLLNLFFRMFTSGDEYTLVQLKGITGYTKQRLLAYFDIFRRANYCEVVRREVTSREVYYSLKAKVNFNQIVPMSTDELKVLFLCRDFTRQVIGDELFKEATSAISKSRNIVMPRPARIESQSAAFIPGTIDYSGKNKIIMTLIECIEERKVCKVKYKATMSDRASTFKVEPMKIFSHFDTMYVDTKYHNKKPGGFDPLLAIHRIEEAEKTGQTFLPDGSYNFEEHFNRHFGVIKKELIRASVQLEGWAARFASERQWSADQHFEPVKGVPGRKILHFYASSEEELVSWLLAWGNEAKLLGPVELVEKVRMKIHNMLKNYPEPVLSQKAKPVKKKSAKQV